MISINDHIRYLLMRHDCVVVPGFGAFVMQTESASYDIASGRFTPPYRRVGFNSDVRHDDGMLTSSVARREGVSYDVARKMVENDLSMLRSRLSSSKMAIMPRLGRFDVGQEGEIVFTTDATYSTVNWQFAGLPSVAARKMTGSAEVASESDKILEVGFGKRAARWIRVAASVALLVGLGAVISTPVLVDNDSLRYASLATPEVVTKAHAIELPVPTPPREMYCLIPTAEDATGSVDLKEFACEQRRKKMMEQIAAYNAAKIERARKSDKPLAVGSAIADHYLIVASCSTRREAERYVKRRAGQSLGIVEGDGHYRVYIASSNSRDVVETARTPELTKHYPGAWIYSRK